MRAVISTIRMLVHWRLASNSLFERKRNRKITTYQCDTVIKVNLMKNKKAVFIEGHIIANRLFGDARPPFCIHRVMFSNGKYAIVRAASGICFSPGDVIQRNDCEWFFNDEKTRLLSFEYLEENESQRQLLEY